MFGEPYTNGVQSMAKRGLVKNLESCVRKDVDMGIVIVR